ncbi:o-succinylbenzoate--CoA ligase [Leuconostocaceae bacterium ESL0723]|nr:o-succinylbenzoate--CoA ligase [Leuconostocaceae bacterium ESL0723]
MENWLTKRVNLTPARPAVTFEDQVLTFAEVAKKANDLAAKVSPLSDQPRIGLVIKNDLASYLTILAVLQTGKTIVFFNRRLAAPEIDQQIQDANLDLVITDDDYSVDLAVRQQLTLEELRTNPANPDFAPVKNYEPEAIASVMYTSGTTGKPKGVLQSFANHFYSAMGSALNLGLQADDAWLTVVPLFHISGFSIMMRQLLYGMRLDLMAKFDAHAVNQRLLTKPVSHISVVPVMLQEMLADLKPGQVYQDKFRVLLLGGGPSSKAMLQAAQDHQIPVVQSYGMTETASQVVALDPQMALAKLGSVGKPLFPVSLKLVDDQGQPSQVGQVWLQTPTLSPGYLNQAKRATGPDAWFDTGDYGHLDEDGFLYIAGRRGDMISSGGENVFPQEVEEVLGHFPGLNQVVVVGQPDAKWGMVPVAILDRDIDIKDLRAYGRTHLAHYKAPQRFYWTDHWPRTASGKIKRQALQDQLNQLKELK